jgi:hypothetical protein
VLPLAVPAPHAVVPITPFALKRWRRRDTWALAALVLTSVLYASVVHLSLDDRFFAIPKGNDVWFEADMPVVSDTMLHRWSDHARNAHHPLFALMTTTPTYALRPILPARARVAFVVAFVALVWGAVVYLLMRALTDSVIDAMTFSVLTFVSAASIFWLPAAETYALGSASLLVPVALLAWDSRRKMPDWCYVAASAASLSVTTTNWVSGVTAPMVARSSRAAIQIIANALVIVVVFWIVQVLVIPSVPFFLSADPGRRFIFPDSAGGPFTTATALLFHSIVMPSLGMVMESHWGQRLTVQSSALGSSGLLGTAATVLWLVLLIAGLVATLARSRSSLPHRALLATLGSQLILYGGYGEETFLYALHVAPLLVACASASTATRARRPLLCLAWVLIVLLAVNNVAAIMHAAQFFAWVPEPRP